MQRHAAWRLEGLRAALPALREEQLSSARAAGSRVSLLHAVHWYCSALEESSAGQVARLESALGAAGDVLAHARESRDRLAGCLVATHRTLAGAGASAAPPAEAITPGEQPAAAAGSGSSSSGAAAVGSKRSRAASVNDSGRNEGAAKAGAGALDQQSPRRSKRRRAVVEASTSAKVAAPGDVSQEPGEEQNLVAAMHRTSQGLVRALATLDRLVEYVHQAARALGLALGLAR